MKYIYTINEDDTIDSLCDDFGLDKSYFDNVSLRVGNRVLIDIPNKPTTPLIHIVKPAETLKMIADMYNVSIDKIKENNQISAIFVGQRLVI